MDKVYVQKSAFARVVDCYEEILDIICFTAYRMYKADWCESRGYDLKTAERYFSCGQQFADGMYVCYDEFEMNEFNDKQLMKKLLDKDLFKAYKEICRVYDNR